jgi:hypothetical protein
MCGGSLPALLAGDVLPGDVLELLLAEFFLHLFLILDRRGNDFPKRVITVITPRAFPVSLKLGVNLPVPILEFYKDVDVLLEISQILLDIGLVDVEAW